LPSSHPRNAKRLALAAGLLAASLATVPGACSRTRPSASLLLITIDTLRADHLSAYGYSRPTSPRIETLARQGMVFRNTFATVPRTTQSVATILTGLYPKHHRARGLFSFLPPGNTTLSEILKERGYSTWAVVSNIFLQPGKGFEQGFDSYSNPRSRFDGDSSRQVTDEALQRIAAAPPGSPFFLWVHYLDPHWSYEPEPRFAAMFDPGYRPSEAMKEMVEGKFHKGDIIFNNPLDPADRRHLVALYDGEIAQVDEQVGRLLDGIPPEVRENLLIVLTSDHGESLGEHGYSFAHGEYLYDGTLRVPLLFVFPGRVPLGEQSRFASLLDVAPSILRLLGLPDRPGMDGIPLFAAAGSGMVPAGSHDLLFAETDYQLIHSANPRFFVPGVQGRWSCSRRGPRKLIRIPHPGGDLRELYDLSADPEESRPLDPAADPGAAQLERDLDGWADLEEGAGESPEQTLTPEQKERLRSLGYLQ
jgi:arylsulfatase A-like enzyme